MRKLNRFWSGLEALPGLAGVLAEWQGVWRQDYEIGRAFLRPTGRPATSYPCPNPGGDGCPRGVIIHGDGDIVAVCRQVPKQCETISLTRADIVVYELNWKGLCSAVSSALEITSLSRPAGIWPGTVRVGHYPLATGNRGFVYLTIQHEMSGFREAVGRLLTKNDLPFVLLAPTADLCEAESQDLLGKSGALLLALDESLALGKSGTLTSTKTAQGLLSSFAAEATSHRRGKFAPVSTSETAARRDSPGVRPIRVPEGARWKDLHLTVDDHRLTFRILHEHGERSFQTAGFEDRRRRDRSNHLWELLRLFAKRGGSLRDEPADPRKQQNLKYSVSRLRACLHALFPMTGDPIVKREGESYSTAFRITSKDRVVVSVPADTTWRGVSVFETRTGNIRFTIDTKRRYVALADGRLTEFSQEFPKEAAERPHTETQEYDLWELGLLEEDGQVNLMGRALLDILRAGGSVKRGMSDKGLIELGGLLCRITGIEGNAFDFQPERGEWSAVFEARSEGGQR